MSTQKQDLEWWQAALLNLSNGGTDRGVNTGAYTRYEIDPLGNVVPQGDQAGTTFAAPASVAGVPAEYVFIALVAALVWLWRRG